MFGRRNPDHANEHQTMPLKSDLDLDMLDDLPDITPEQPAKPATPPAAPAEPAPEDSAWSDSGPVILGPSVTQLLREAESTPHPAAEPVSNPYQPSAAATVQLPAYAPEANPAAEQPAQAGAPAYSFAAPAAEVADEPAAPPAAPVVRAVPAERARVIAESVIGPDDFFDGRYRSERGVRIQGNARGSIESRQYIFVEAGAQVEADLSAEEITVAGDFSGKITCRGRLEVTNSGKIQGQVETVLLVVQEGGALDGELSMRKNSEPAAS